MTDIAFDLAIEALFLRLDTDEQIVLTAQLLSIASPQRPLVWKLKPEQRFSSRQARKRKNNRARASLGRR